MVKGFSSMCRRPGQRSQESSKGPEERDREKEKEKEEEEGFGLGFGGGWVARGIGMRQ